MRGYQMQGEGGRVFEDERPRCKVAQRVSDHDVRSKRETEVGACTLQVSLFNAFTVRRYFFDWLVDLA